MTSRVHLYALLLCVIFSPHLYPEEPSSTEEIKSKEKSETVIETLPVERILQSPVAIAGIISVVAAYTLRAWYIGKQLETRKQALRHQLAYYRRLLSSTRNFCVRTDKTTPETTLGSFFLNLSSGNSIREYKNLWHKYERVLRRIMSELETILPEWEHYERPEYAVQIVKLLEEAAELYRLMHSMTPLLDAEYPALFVHEQCERINLHYQGALDAQRLYNNAELSEEEYKTALANCVMLNGAEARFPLLKGLEQLSADYLELAQRYTHLEQIHLRVPLVLYNSVRQEVLSLIPLLYQIQCGIAESAQYQEASEAKRQSEYHDALLKMELEKAHLEERKVRAMERQVAMLAQRRKLKK